MMAPSVTVQGVDGVADRAEGPRPLCIKELVVGGGAVAGFGGDIHA